MWIWLAVAVLAALGELVTYDLFLAPVAVAGVIVALIALVAPFPLQVSLFAGLSLLGIMFLRPILKHVLGLDSLPPHTETIGQSSVVGRRAIVTQTVGAHGGQIRIGDGEFWTARSFDPTETHVTGQTVEVMLVDGVAALVEAVPTVSRSQAIGVLTSIEKGVES